MENLKGPDDNAIWTQLWIAELWLESVRRAICSITFPQCFTTLAWVISSWWLPPLHTLYMNSDKVFLNPTELKSNQEWRIYFVADWSEHFTSLSYWEIKSVRKCENSRREMGGKWKLLGWDLKEKVEGFVFCDLGIWGNSLYLINRGKMLQTCTDVRSWFKPTRKLGPGHLLHNSQLPRLVYRNRNNRTLTFDGNSKTQNLKSREDGDGEVDGAGERRRNKKTLFYPGIHCHHSDDLRLLCHCLCLLIWHLWSWWIRITHRFIYLLWWYELHFVHRRRVNWPWPCAGFVLHRDRGSRHSKICKFIDDILFVYISTEYCTWYLLKIVFYSVFLCSWRSILLVFFCMFGNKTNFVIFIAIILNSIINSQYLMSFSKTYFLYIYPSILLV